MRIRNGKAVKTARPVDADVRKAARTERALSELSKAVRFNQLQKAPKPLRRGQDAAPLSPPSPKTKVSLRVNLSGPAPGLTPAETEHSRRLKQMRRFYNRKMPVLQCNGCSFASSCPQFKAGYECAFLPFLNSHRIETEQDLIFYMKELAGVNLRRAHLATTMETLSGAQPSLETSEALNLAFMQLKGLHDTMAKRTEAELSLETEDGSIIGKLFGGMDRLLQHTQEAKETPIHALPVVSQSVDIASEPGNSEGVNEDLIREHSRAEVSREAGVIEVPMQKQV